MAAQTVYLIRHGQVNSNVIRYDQAITIAAFNHLVLHEIPAEPLDAAGIAQVQAIMPRIASFNLKCLYVSPLLRARQTAEILAIGSGVPLIIRDDLYEIIRAPLHGPPTHELSLRSALIRSGLRQVLPWLQEAEPLGQVYRRSGRAWHEMTAQTEGDFGIVGHQGFFRALFARLYPSRRWRVIRRETHNAGISIVQRRL